MSCTKSICTYSSSILLHANKLLSVRISPARQHVPTLDDKNKSDVLTYEETESIKNSEDNSASEVHDSDWDYVEIQDILR